jgi:hypothetical protein
LPDADGAWFVVLNDRFGEAIRSLIGHFRKFAASNWVPYSGHLQQK